MHLYTCLCRDSQWHTKVFVLVWLRMSCHIVTYHSLVYTHNIKLSEQAIDESMDNFLKKKSFKQLLTPSSSSSSPPQQKIICFDNMVLSSFSIVTRWKYDTSVLGLNKHSTVLDCFCPIQWTAKHLNNLLPPIFLFAKKQNQASSQLPRHHSFRCWGNWDDPSFRLLLGR